MSITRRFVNYRPLTEESSTGKNDQLQGPTGKDLYCISYKKLPPQLVDEKHLYPEHVLFSKGLCFKTTFPTLSPWSNIPLLSWTYLWFCHSSFVLNCNSLLLPNKLIFAGKITFIIKVNSIYITSAYNMAEIFSRSLVLCNVS